MTNLQYQYFTGKFEGHQRAILFYQSWRPVFCDKVVVMVHGLGEHSGRYKNLVDCFVNKEVGFYGYDQRGHGRSKGQRGHVHSFSELTSDLRQFLKLVSVHENGKPVILFGHSLGGLICLRYLIECESKSGVLPAAAILSNPTLKISVAVPAWKELLSASFSRFLPRLSLHNQLNLDYLSHDPKVAEDVKKDSLCHQRITLRFYREILNSIEFVRKNGELLRVPMQFLLGSEDGIIDPRGAEAFFQTLEVPEKELKLYPGFYHELIHEQGKEAVFSDINRWIGQFGQ